LGELSGGDLGKFAEVRAGQGLAELGLGKASRQRGAAWAKAGKPDIKSVLWSQGMTLEQFSS
jgi:hypothetical protein